MGTLKAYDTLRLRRIVALSVGAFCVLLALRSHYQVVIVLGASMRPTLTPGDLLVVDKKAYRARDPVRGDIIVARYRNELVTKRIVALPAEEVQVKQGTLYINGQPKLEGYPIERGCLDIGKGKLLEGAFATLGDNRSIPAQLSVHPIVSKENIVGKVVLSLGWWPKPGWKLIRPAPRSNSRGVV